MKQLTELQSKALQTSKSQRDLQDTEIEELTVILGKYLRADLRERYDMTSQVRGREEIIIHGERCYKYSFPPQTIYLTMDNEAITYQNQLILRVGDEITLPDGSKHIIDESEEGYYYDFNEKDANDATPGSGTYTWIHSSEWRRMSIYDE